MEETLLYPGEELEDLGEGVRIILSPRHRFGTDALLLAHFATPRQGERVCDLCTGCGILPLLFCRAPLEHPVTAVELQPEAADQLRRSLRLNRLEERVIPLEADLKTLPSPDLHQTFHLVTANPPYQPAGSGLLSGERWEQLARHEIACTLEDVALTASRMLTFGGRFCLCHRPERLVDILTTLRKVNLEPKRLQFVVLRERQSPWLVLVEGKKGGKKGLVQLPQLVMKEASGEDTGVMKQIYGGYAK